MFGAVGVMGLACQRGQSHIVCGKSCKVGLQDLFDIPAVTASEAAEMLGVSTARVAQLCRDGSLNSWKIGNTRMVSRDSIEYRLAAKPVAGRPPRASFEG